MTHLSHNSLQCAADAAIRDAENFYGCAALLILLLLGASAVSAALCDDPMEPAEGVYRVDAPLSCCVHAMGKLNLAELC